MRQSGRGWMSNQLTPLYFCSTNACLTSGKSATPVFKNLTKLKLLPCKTSETQPLKQSPNNLTLPNLTTPKNLYFAYPQSLVPTRQTLHPNLGTWVSSTTEFLPFIICIYLEEMYIINIIVLSLDFEDTQNFFAKQKINGIISYIPQIKQKIKRGNIYKNRTPKKRQR